MSIKRRNLTDSFLKNLEAAPKGTRYAISDLQCPGLKVRVTDNGTASFIVWRRFGGATNPSARLIGRVGEIGLADARTKAREWVAASRAGKDPAVEEAKRAEAEAERAAATFGLAMEAYYRHIAGQRRSAGARADIERDVLPFWRNKSLHEITRKDVAKRVKEIADGKYKKKPTLFQAHAAFSNIRSFFNWARDSAMYGLEVCPTDAMRPSKIIGVRHSRQRVLSDDELLAFCRHAEAAPYPLGPMLKLLLLTGARKSEVTEAEWREVDLNKGLLTIPPERFKSNATHLIPLSKAAINIVSELPRWKGNKFVFTHNSHKLGEGIEAKSEVMPANIWTKDKCRLDTAMLATLKQLALDRREDPAEVRFEPFVVHDLRRTVRTRLSALGVSDTVAEMIIGHGKKGIQRVYDLHRYESEMRIALERWSSALSQIVNPPPSSGTVVAFARGGIAAR